MSLHKKRKGPSDTRLHPRNLRTKHVIDIPDDEPKSEERRARAEEVGDGRFFLGWDVVFLGFVGRSWGGGGVGGGGGRGRSEHVCDTECGGDDERGEDDLVVYRVPIHHTNNQNISSAYTNHPYKKRNEENKKKIKTETY